MVIVHVPPANTRVAQLRLDLEVELAIHEHITTKYAGQTQMQFAAKLCGTLNNTQNALRDRLHACGHRIQLSHWKLG